MTGSNAKLLSKDVITEFRGRGWEIRVHPLSFKEFADASSKSIDEAYKEYSSYGGLPKLFDFKNENDKAKYLKQIFEETYINDIVERNGLKNQNEISSLLDFLASSIGSLTNPTKLANSFVPLRHTKMHPDTIRRYISYLLDSFLIEAPKRYDISGKGYIESPSKYYFADIGLRNARLNFREMEQQKIMENIVYNDLVIKGYSVDVGVLDMYEQNKNGKSVLKRTEVDFVCNQADRRYYIQVAYSLDSLDKLHQEQRPLLGTKDAFKKIIIVRDSIPTHYNEDGILMMGLYDFLLNDESLKY